VRQRLARTAALRIVIPLSLLLPMLVIFVAWIVDRGLKPLQRLTTEVQQRDARSMTPLPQDGLPREIEPLVKELNRLLERLRDAFAVQRHFIADAAHELRSPLTALRLQMQLLDRAPDEAARSEARARLGDAVARSIHLVEQLLALARSEPRETPVEFVAVDLAAVSAQAIADTHALALERHIDLGLEAASAVPLNGDPEALRILVRNLVDNAVRYTPQGGAVQVHCAEVADGALLKVDDTGPGLAPALRERVFDRFFRRAALQESGTGLGLAIVKAIAERHGASITLGSAPGGGLQVCVRFPAAS
jgi:two-component system OmpR family sensor kinase/two-component system sensor histidine kinase QseC